MSGLPIGGMYGNWTDNHNHSIGAYRARCYIRHDFRGLQMVPEAREAGQGHQGDKGRADPFDLWCPCLFERLERARLRRASHDCDKPDRKTHKQTSSQITGGQKWTI